MAPAFKVVVVGSGPVGLVAAHALSHAGVDFVVLEQRPQIVEEAGAILVMLPNGQRVLGQLGLFDALDLCSTDLVSVERIDHSRNSLGYNKIFEHFKINHGRYPITVNRRDLTRVLYDALSPEDRARIIPNKKVCDVQTHPDGVIIKCTDGQIIEGNMLVGADGAHSVVRSSLRALAIQNANSLSSRSPMNPEQPYLTTYRCMWMRFPTAALGMEAGQAKETHGPGLAIQLFAGEEFSVAAMYERLGESTRERSRFSQADMDAFIARWGHLPINSKFTVKDAYDRHSHLGMVNLEEGVVDQWSGDRIVLVGDAAHKFTPSTGMGCNNGIMDVVVLINELQKVLENQRQSATGDPHVEVLPTTEELQTAFKVYQEARIESAKASCAASAKATATASWDSWMLKLMDQYIIPTATLQNYMISKSASKIAASPILNCIKGEEPMEGLVPWVHRIQQSV